MFYKVIKNGKVIDVLEQLIYLKYQPKYGVMVLTNENEAQAILSSDKESIWHEVTLYNVPVPGYETVTVAEIDEQEYRQLKLLNCRSVDEILDSYTLLLIQEGVI